MLKNLLIIAVTAAMGISLLHVVHVCAQEPDGTLMGGLDTAADNSGLIKEGEPEELIAQEIGKYVKIALGFVGIILLIIILYAGIVWMTAGGKTANLDNARKIIISAAIGLAVTLMAYSVTAFVIKRIGEALK